MATKLETLSKLRADIEAEEKRRKEALKEELKKLAAEKKEELKKEAAQRKAKLNKAIALELSKAKKAQRNDDNRRKILAGAWILEQFARKGKTPLEIGATSDAPFKDWLTRPDDRALFGLPPLEAQEPSRQE